MRPPRALFAALAMVVIAWSAPGSGADEKDKDKARAKAKPPAPSYTDEDLKKYKEPPREGETGAQSAGSSEEPSTGAEPSSGRGSFRDEYREGRPRVRREGEPPTKPGVDPPPSDEPPNPEEEMWRTRAAEARRPLQEAQARIQGIESEMADLRDKLNPMSTKYVLGGNSTAGPGAIYEVEEQLRVLEGQLLDARTAAAEAERSWQRFVDEARAAGASPAWLNP